MSKSPLVVEAKYFAENKARFIRRYKNQVLLIKGRQVIGSFSSTADAYRAGLEKFGNIPMFITKVKDKEQTPISFFLAFR